MKQNNQIRNSRSRKIGVGVGFALATIAVGSAIAVPNIIAYQNRPQSTNNTSWEEGKYGEGGGYYTAPVEVTDPSTQVFKATVTATDHEVNKIALYNLTGETLTLPIAPSVKSIKVAGNELTLDDYYIENNIIILTKTVSGSDKIEVELTINEPIIDGSYVVTRMWNENTKEYDEEEVNMEYKPSADVPGFYSDTTKAVPISSSNIIKFKCVVTEPNQICRFELNNSERVLSDQDYTLVSVWNGNNCEFLNDNGESGVYVANQWTAFNDRGNEQWWQRTTGPTTGEFTFVVVGNSNQAEKCYAVGTNEGVVESHTLTWNSEGKMYSTEQMVELTASTTYMFSLIVGSGIPKAFYLFDGRENAPFTPVLTVVKRNGLPLKGENNNWEYKNDALVRKSTATTKLQENDVVEVYLKPTNTGKYTACMESTVPEKTYPMTWVENESHQWGGYYLSVDTVVLTTSEITFEITLPAGVASNKQFNTFSIGGETYGLSTDLYTITSITKGGDSTEINNWTKYDKYYERGSLAGAGTYKFTLKSNKDELSIKAKMSNETKPSKDIGYTWKDDTTYSVGGYHNSDSTTISKSENTTFKLELTGEEGANKQFDTFSVYDESGNVIQPNQYEIVSIYKDGVDDKDHWTKRQLCLKRDELFEKGIFTITIKSKESDWTVKSIISNEHQFSPLEMEWNGSAEPKGFYSNEKCSIAIGNPKGFKCTSTSEHPINTFAACQTGPMSLDSYCLESVTLDDGVALLDDTKNWRIDTEQKCYVRYVEDVQGTYTFKISKKPDGGTWQSQIYGRASHQTLEEPDMKWDETTGVYKSTPTTITSQQVSYTCKIGDFGINAFGLYYQDGEGNLVPCACTVGTYIKSDLSKEQLKWLDYNATMHFTTEDMVPIENDWVTFHVSVDQSFVGKEVFAMGWKSDIENIEVNEFDPDDKAFTSQDITFYPPAESSINVSEYSITFNITDDIAKELTSLQFDLRDSAGTLIDTNVQIGRIILEEESKTSEDYHNWEHDDKYNIWKRKNDGEMIVRPGKYTIIFAPKVTDPQECHVHFGNEPK